MKKLSILFYFSFLIFSYIGLSSNKAPNPPIEGYELRLIEPKDVPVVRALWETCLDETVTLSSWYKKPLMWIAMKVVRSLVTDFKQDLSGWEYKHGQRAFFVVSKIGDSRNIIACIGIKSYQKVFSDIKNEQKTCTFQRFSVHPFFRRRGLGKFLVQTMLKKAQSNIFSCDRLEVESSNPLILSKLTGDNSFEKTGYFTFRKRLR